MSDRKFLYGEDEDVVQPITSNNQPISNELMIYLDFEKDSILELTQKVRTFTIHKPDNIEINLYIISGHNCKKDVELFIQYLSKLNYNFIVYIRGIIHPYFIHLLFDKNVFIEGQVKMLYRKDLLHDLLTNLMLNPKIFKTFVQRFIDQYNKFPECYIDVTELKQIGFEFETF